LNLEQQMAIESLGTGRSVLFRIRRDHPFANDLATLFEAEESRFQAIIATVGQIADADIEILALWFYGSAAREEDSPASDVDFTLAVRRGAAPQAQALFRERIAFIESLYAFDASVIAIDEDDIVRLAGESDPWWNTLVRDAIVLRGSRPEDMARRLSQAANNS
jgi:predicted nucleotidyltransferase